MTACLPLHPRPSGWELFQELLRALRAVADKHGGASLLNMHALLGI